MTAAYEEILSLAKRKGFHHLTKLQDLTFSTPGVLDSDRDVFVQGETSSGKTLIPILMYDLALQKAKEENKKFPKMLFVVPYRALASQKMREIREYFKDEELDIVQSTGEFRQFDADVQKANLDIAVVITEKAYRYASKQDAFLRQYDFLVLDEIGLINNDDRGSKLDFLFAWAKELKSRCGRPRTVSLGTPFYDWGAYIRNYEFIKISGVKRPVRLSEYPVHYGENNLLSVPEGNHPLHKTRYITEKAYLNLQEHSPGTTAACDELQVDCPIITPCRMDQSLICEKLGGPCKSTVCIKPKGVSSIRNIVIETLCRWYIKQGKQVLIFINKRDEVQELCRLLYGLLQDILPVPEDDCKKRILEDCGLEEDDVYGIMKEEHYEAFAAGIGFHNAGMPNELRSYVEERLLESREMKVVCCTETLAFGVNSSVDAVIVADLMKRDNNIHRFLTLNEYKNYVGRAGRLQKTDDGSAAEGEGYIYPLIRDEALLKVKNKKKTEYITQKEYWDNLEQTTEQPKRLYSHFYDVKNTRVPFFLLNLISTDDESTSLEKLQAITDKLPRPGGCPAQVLYGIYRESLQFLLEENLIVKRETTQAQKRRRSEQEVPQETTYALTQLGARMRGYVLSTDDYVLLRRAVNLSIRGEHIEEETLIYNMLQSEFLGQPLSNIPDTSKKRISREELNAFFENRLGTRSRHAPWLKTMQQAKEEELQIFYILAALLSWAEGTSPRALCDRFGVIYPILQRIAERVAYFLEIAQEILPAILEKWYYTKAAGKTELPYEELLDRLSEEIQLMFYAVSYGISLEIHGTLVAYLERQEDMQARELASKLELSLIEPKQSRLLRRIGIRYRFYQQVDQMPTETVEQRNNLNYQIQQYRQDIKRMGPHIERFFIETFGEKY